MSTFYYNMKQLYLLTTLNVVLLLGVICISNFFNDFMWWNAVVTVLCLTALSSSLFVTLFPQKLAIVSSEGIKIDHNELLKWQDIECVEKIKLSRFLGREIIVFKLKDNKSYDIIDISDATIEYVLNEQGELIKEIIVLDVQVDLDASIPATQAMQEYKIASLNGCFTITLELNIA